MSTHYLHAVPWKNVRIEESFWGDWVRVNRDVLVPLCLLSS